jgi:hypothetical protein
LFGLTSLFYGRDILRFTERFKQDMSQKTSTIVVATRWELDNPEPPPALRWLMSEFKPVPGVPDLGPFRLLVRKDAMNRIGVIPENK